MAKALSFAPGRGPSPNGPVLLARRTQARVGDRDRDQGSVGICPQTPSHFLTAGPHRGPQ
jgi:hypothetical protein